MGTIELNGLEFHAFHGCTLSEKVEGNLFMVDFRADVDVDRAAESDDLKDTLDYSAVYDLIAGEMAVRSNLLENVAGRILNAVKAAFPQMERCTVRVSKRNPPVAGKAEWSRVTLSFERGGDKEAGN